MYLEYKSSALYELFGIFKEAGESKETSETAPDPSKKKEDPSNKTEGDPEGTTNKVTNVGCHRYLSICQYMCACLLPVYLKYIHLHRRSCGAKNK